MGAGTSTGAMPAATIHRFWDPADCYREGRRPSLHSDRQDEPLSPECEDPDSDKRGQPLPEPGVDALGAFCILGCGDELARRVSRGREALQRVRAVDGQQSGASASRARVRGASPPSRAGGNGRSSASQVPAQQIAELDRALGCILGNIVGDALGMPMEFTPVVYGKHDQEARGVITGLNAESGRKFWHKDTKIKYVPEGRYEYNTFNLALGQWTDDGSMALCLLDSLICGGESRSSCSAAAKSMSAGITAGDADGEPQGSDCHALLDDCPPDFDPVDLRHRFHAWGSFGYNNAFGRDAFEPENGRELQKEGRCSVGLGSNVGQSVREWTASPPTAQEVASDSAKEAEDKRSYTDLAFTRSGDKYTSGNGSLMRNSPVPVWFRDNVDQGMAAARAQSRTTHAGLEAAELCRLLTWICIAFIKGGNKEEVLGDITGKRRTEAAAEGGEKPANAAVPVAAPRATTRERRATRESAPRSAGATCVRRSSRANTGGSTSPRPRGNSTLRSSSTGFSSLNFPPFRSPLYSVTCLANSEAETEEAFVHPQPHEDPFFGDLSCRDWNWRSPRPRTVPPSVPTGESSSRHGPPAVNRMLRRPALSCYRYAQQRVDANTGYAGSYSMDGMAMALHFVWTSNCFEEAVLKAANLGGDADTVCAITAQMAGALWGASAIPEAWVRVVDDRWAGGTVAARALMCFEREKLGPEVWRGESAVQSAELLGTPWT